MTVNYKVLLIYKGWSEFFFIYYIVSFVIWGTNEAIVTAVDPEARDVQPSMWEATGMKVHPAVCNAYPCDLIVIAKQMLIGTAIF